MSTEAKQYVKAWLHEQDVGNINIQGWESRELEQLFRDSNDARDRVVALAVCVFKPAVHWLVAQYCGHLQEGGRTLPDFDGQSRNLDTVRGLQVWVEEIIFGGELSLTDQHQVLAHEALQSSHTNLPVAGIAFTQTAVCTRA